MLYIIFTIAIIVAFILGAQTGFTLTKRTVKLKLAARLVEIDKLGLYSMVWYRGYATALQWADRNLFDDLDADEEGFVI